MAAAMYSIMTTSKKNRVDQQQWLTYVLEKNIVAKEIFSHQFT